jgi:hypothetical protein
MFENFFTKIKKFFVDVSIKYIYRTSYINLVINSVKSEALIGYLFSNDKIEDSSNKIYFGKVDLKEKKCDKDKRKKIVDTVEMDERKKKVDEEYE